MAWPCGPASTAGWLRGRGRRRSARRSSGPLSTPAGRRLSAGVYGTFLRRELPALLAGSRAGQRLRHRTLWLHGADDRILVPPLVESLRPHADELEIEYVDGVGHFIVDERPELVAERALSLFAA